MKGLMFGVALVLTGCIVIGGVLVHPLIIGRTVRFINNYVFSFSQPHS